MERKEIQMFRKWEWVLNAWLVTATLFIMAPMAWGLDIQDITVEWTEAGKKIAAERVAKWKTKDDMVLVLAGEFVMGSDKKTDRLAYRSEIPQRRVYLDAFKIGKYEVTALEYLGFVLATNRSPQLDWRYDGGNFQEPMAHHPIMHVSWYDADAFCKWAASGCPPKRNGRKRRAGWTGGSFPGAKNMRGRPGQTSGGPDSPVQCGTVPSGCCSILRSFPSTSTRTQ